MRMRGGDMPTGRGSAMEGAVAPGVTIIINMHGMPMMGAQAGSQGMAGSMDMGGQGKSAMPGMGAATGTEEAARGAAMQAYVEAMARMHRDMAVSASGDPDADFARMMIPHDQGLSTWLRWSCGTATTLDRRVRDGGLGARGLPAAGAGAPNGMHPRAPRRAHGRQARRSARIHYCPSANSAKHEVRRYTASQNGTELS
jgi:hypothetical protein